MIMDGKHTDAFVSLVFTDLHFSINVSANPLKREVSCQMAPGAFAAAIAEFNSHNGSFDDE
jgi:hypothetical protein